jgi:hypothetical protein
MMNFAAIWIGDIFSINSIYFECQIFISNAHKLETKIERKNPFYIACNDGNTSIVALYIIAQLQNLSITVTDVIVRA